MSYMLKRLNHKDNGYYILTRRGKKVKIAMEKNAAYPSEYRTNDALFDQKLEAITEGLEYYHLKLLKTKISAANALTMAKYILAMKTEANISDSRRSSIITSLKLLSEFLDNKPFEQMTREDVISYLNTLRRQESEDPYHRWIGSYNLKLGCFVKFFKWLYYPEIEPGKRERPEVIVNIQFLKRKEKSVYKPGDLWTAEDHNTFLKYCGNKLSFNGRRY